MPVRDGETSQASIASLPNRYLALRPNNLSLVWLTNEEKTNKPQFNYSVLATLRSSV